MLQKRYAFGGMFRRSPAHRNVEISKEKTTMAHRPQAAQRNAHFVMCLPHGLKAAPKLACNRGAAINHSQPLSSQGAALQARRCHSLSRRAVCRLTWKLIVGANTGCSCTSQGLRNVLQSRTSQLLRRSTLNPNGAPDTAWPLASSSCSPSAPAKTSSSPPPLSPSGWRLPPPMLPAHARSITC